MVAAFRREFEPAGVEILSLVDVAWPEPRTRGRDLAEIATGKAAVIAAYTNRPTVGIAASFEIDALRRYSGGGPRRHFPDPWPHSEEQLVSELNHACEELDRCGYLGPDDRGAYFHCVMCLAWPDAETRMFESFVDGQIAPAIAEGAATFGHYFVPDGEQMTLAQMDSDRRSIYSHHKRAIRLVRLSAVATGAEGPE